MRDIADQLRPNGCSYHPDVWKEQIKRTILGTTEEQLPCGEVLITAVSTAKLDRAEFSAFMVEVEAWATEQGVRFSEPSRRYLREYQDEAQRRAGSRSAT